jgi:tRNA(Ile)-lysidine synthase TilS/MesJ
MRQVTLAALDSFAKRVGAGYANPNRFAVALSGGPDSTALAHIFGEWHQQTRATAGDRIRPPKCIIVNHNLRKGSEREAQGVAEMARGMGLEPVLCSLDLKGEKRVSQQQARHGRLKAIFSACLRE